jgi:hypothetical protein
MGTKIEWVILIVLMLVGGYLISTIKPFDRAAQPPIEVTQP